MSEARPNPGEGLLVRGWQHNYETHIAGCPASHYYAEACSDACMRAHDLIGPLTKEEIAELPIDSPSQHGGGVENYG